MPKIDGLSCFPNPATEQIRITSDNGSIDVIVVYDVLGNEVTLNTPTNNYASIDVADLGKRRLYCSSYDRNRNEYYSIYSRIVI